MVKDRNGVEILININKDCFSRLYNPFFVFIREEYNEYYIAVESVCIK